MSELLRYEIETNHEETIAGRIIGSDLAFEVYIARGQYRVTLIQDGTDKKDGIHKSIAVHGGTLPTLIAALNEIHLLYSQAVGRKSRSESEVDK
jgi:hypothetical protein